MSQMVLYFVHSTSVLAFYIDVVLTLMSGAQNTLLWILMKAISKLKHLATYQVVFHTINICCFSLPNHGQKKRGFNRQSPEPSLFCTIQCIHHFAICNNQTNDNVTNCLTSMNSRCPTASLAQQIDLISSRWLHDITESLVSQFRKKIENFRCQLSMFRLNHSDSEKAQSWQKNGHIKNLDPSWKIVLW